MKKLDTTALTTYIPNTKMYLDHVGYVFSKLNSLGLDIEISDDENTYDSLGELISIKGINPKLIKIHGKRKEQLFGYIQLRLTDKGSSVHVHSDETLLRTGYEIEKHFLSKK